MPFPFRNNPKINTNWVNNKTGKILVAKTKKAYYEISASKEPGKIVISFREEKKRLGGSAEKVMEWLGGLSFEVDATFARDLKMFLNEYVDKDPEEVKNTVRIFFEKKEWIAKLGDGKEGKGETIQWALKDLAEKVNGVNEKST
jgi:hypothetical protein